MLRNHQVFKRNDKVHNKMKDEELYSKNSLKNLLLVPLPEVLKVIISKQQKKFLGGFSLRVLNTHLSTNQKVCI